MPPVRLHCETSTEIDMLCRVAECVFWMSRYVERAENAARFLEVNQELSLDGEGGISAQWQPLIDASGDQKLFSKHYKTADEDSVVRFLLFDKRNPNSLLSSIAMARENARMVRNTLSVPFWDRMNRFYIDVKDAARDVDNVIRSPQKFLDQTIESSQILMGIEESTISHGEGFNFSGIGRLLERADKTSRILDVKYFTLLPNVKEVGKALDVVQWSALLQSSSGLAMYRRAYGRLRPERIVDFLIRDRAFPRSLQCCVEGSHRSLSALVNDDSPEAQHGVVRAVFAGRYAQLAHRFQHYRTRSA